jgi:hypothetical protein
LAVRAALVDGAFAFIVEQKDNVMMISNPSVVFINNIFVGDEVTGREFIYD